MIILARKLQRKKSSIPHRVYVLNLEVRKLKEFHVSSIHEEDSIPVYSHSKPACGQRRSCGQEANVSEAGV